LGLSPLWQAMQDFWKIGRISRANAASADAVAVLALASSDPGLGDELTGLEYFAISACHARILRPSLGHSATLKCGR